jgi:hypothetical protein
MRLLKYIHVTIALLSLPVSSLLFAQTSAEKDASLEIALQGTISPEKIGTHETQTFVMPKGIERMEVELDSPGFAKGMYVTVGMWDPDRYRGEGRAKFSISTVTASGPYISGPLVAGTWKVSFGFNYIAPGAHGKYTLRIHLSKTLDPEHYTVLNPKPGWYMGDLHSHTGYTDAVCKSQSGKNVPCPAFKLFEAAAQQKLDFLAVTEHNTQAHFNEMEHVQPYYDKLLLIAGEEVTTTRGHTNVWGTMGFLDYRAWEKGFTVNDLFDQAHAQGALVSINHWYWPWDGKCPGCGWGWMPITEFSKVDSIEVINGYHEHGSWFTPPPGNGIPLWDKLHGEGLRPTGVGGGDEHRGGEQISLHDGVGIPTTVVYARELSQPAILEGIKAGHVYIKTNGPDGPELLLNVGSAMMGDEVKFSAGSAVEFTVSTTDKSGAQLRLYLDGKPINGQPKLSEGRASYTWKSDGKRHWVRAELVDGKEGSDPVVVTNPIYLNWK